MITLVQLLEHDGDEDDADEFIGDEGGETPSMRFGIGGDVGATTGAMNSSVDYTIDEISMKLSELLDIPTALWMEHAVLLDEDSRALAKKMGYKSIGYGRWIDETGKVRARTIKGKLWHLAEELPEEEDRPAHLKEPVLDRTVTTGALPNNFEAADPSPAAQQAKKLGLDYMKFGRYGKNGQVTHTSQNGKLIPVYKGKHGKNNQPEVPSQKSLGNYSGGVTRRKPASIWKDDNTAGSLKLGAKNAIGQTMYFKPDELDYAKEFAAGNESPESYELKLQKLGKRFNNFENTELEEKRDYKREYQLYHAKPEQKKRRAQRNGARRKMERLGHVKKGDGQDVHHSNRNTADNSSKNLKIMPKSKNRSLK